MMDQQNRQCQLCKEMGNVQGCGKVQYSKIIGEGTYGQVFYCIGVDNSVYVEKVLKNASDPKKGEGTLLGKCNHPFVVRAMPSHHGPHVVRMEYCQGGDLYRRIQLWKAHKKYMNEADVVALFVQILFAVQYLHSMVILHRDIKPGNILLETETGPAKLGDFGSSSADVSVGATMVRTLCGTYTNVAPELFQNRAGHTKHTTYNVKAEVWSLGATLYELMTLEPPFPFVPANDPELYAEVLEKVRKADFQRVSDKDLPFSKKLCELCDSMMNLQPNGRPSIRSMLMSEVLRPTAEQIVASYAGTPHGPQLASQWESIVNAKKMDFQTKCLRLSGFRNKPISVQLGRRGNRLLIKEDDSDKDKVVNLMMCDLEEDEFEEGETKYFGVLVTPKGKTSITVGYYDDEEKRNILLRELLVGKEHICE